MSYKFLKPFCSSKTKKMCSCFDASLSTDDDLGGNISAFLNTLALLGHGARGMPLSFYSISFILATICKV